MKFIHQAVECARLLDGIQILPLNVFNESELERLLIAYLSQDNRHAQKLRALRGAPSPLARDELVSCAELSHDQRLDDSARANGLRQFLDSGFCKSCTRLVWAGIKKVDVDLQRSSGGAWRWGDCRRGSRGCSWWNGLRSSFLFTNQSPQPPSQCVSGHLR
jgi:hypothetical protein